MLVLCLATVLVISTSNVAGQSCSYRLTPDSNIIGGITAPAAGLGACQAYCSQNAECQGFDYDPATGACFWLKTQSGVQPKPGIDHYDKSCYEIGALSPPPAPPPPPQDVVSRVGDPRCFKTNYQGPATDFWTASNGVTWNYQIAHFGFDWPQSGIIGGVAGILLSPLVFIDSISFQSSDNLDYFRVVITQNNGNTITTQAIGPNDKSTSVSGANDVRRVDFYLASVDFRRNVSLTDVNLRACTGVSLLKDCAIVNLIKDLIQTASLGIIRPGGTSGTFSASVAPEYPFVELDLNCAGIGTVGFTEVIFDGSPNFKAVMINVWAEDTVVPIPYGDTFSNVLDIKFESSVRGDRIRSTIIPFGVPNQGISESIEFDRYKIIAS